VLIFGRNLGHSVATDERADQLFWEVGPNKSTFCLESDNTFSLTAHAKITGGTGAYAGASGTFESQATGRFLVSGSKNGVLGDFGQFTATTSGTLILPTGGDDGPDDD
jgi:hypothetical protein